MKQHRVLIVVGAFLKRSLDVVLARLPVLPLELHLLRNRFCERDNLFFISINFIVLICKVSCYAIKNKSIFCRNNFLASTAANATHKDMTMRQRQHFAISFCFHWRKSSLNFFIDSLEGINVILNTFPCRANPIIRIYSRDGKARKAI